MVTVLSEMTELLFRGRGRFDWRRHGDWSDLTGKVARAEPSARSTPKLRSELEVAIARLIRHDVYDLRKVRLGVETVQFARGDEGEEICGCRGVIIRAEEKPTAAAGGNISKRALYVSIGQRKPPAIEKASQARLLPRGVAEGGGDKTAHALHASVLHLYPREKLIHQRLRTRESLCVTPRRRECVAITFDLKEPADAKKRLLRGRVFDRGGGFPELSSHVGPAADFTRRRVVRPHARVAAVKRMIDDVGIGLDIAAETAKHLANNGACTFRLIFEEDVILVGKDDEEVAFAARLIAFAGGSGGALGLDAHSSRVGGQTECVFFGVFDARLHNTSECRADVLGIPALHAIVETDAIRREHLAEPMKRHAEAVLGDEHARNHRRREKSALLHFFRHIHRDELTVFFLVGGVGDDNAYRRRAAEAEPIAFFEPNALCFSLEFGVQKLDAFFGQVFARENAAAFG